MSYFPGMNGETYPPPSGSNDNPNNTIPSSSPLTDQLRALRNNLADAKERYAAIERNDPNNQQWRIKEVEIQHEISNYENAIAKLAGHPSLR